MIFNHKFQYVLAVFFATSSLAVSAQAEVSAHVKACGALYETIFYDQEDYNAVSHRLRRLSERHSNATELLANLATDDAAQKAALEISVTDLFYQLQSCIAPKKVVYAHSGGLSKECLKIYKNLNTAARQLARLHDRKTVKQSAILSSKAFKKYSRKSIFFLPNHIAPVTIKRSQLTKTISRLQKDLAVFIPKTDAALVKLTTDKESFRAQCSDVGFGQDL